jgi:chromosome partitioning protein
MIYAVANQKGGVGKTTTVHALGAAFAERGARVLVVDLDPQAGLTVSCGTNPETLQETVYQALLEKVEPRQAIIQTDIANLALFPANLDLAGIEAELIGKLGWERSLTRVLKHVSYDTILLDCPPTLGILTTNALVAAQTVIVPVQCEYLAFRALAQLLKIVENVRKNANADLALKILRTMYDPRTSHAREVFDELANTWPEEVLQSFIKRTVKFADSTVGGSSILEYATESEAAESYRNVCRELSRAEKTSIDNRARRQRVPPGRKSTRA